MTLWEENKPNTKTATPCRVQGNASHMGGKELNNSYIELFSESGFRSSFVRVDR